MKKLTKNKNKGFTIVELIVVMAIIAILILIAVPTFTKYIDDANKTSEMGTADTINKSAMAAVVEDYASPKHATITTGVQVDATGASTESTAFVKSITDGVSGKADIIVYGYNGASTTAPTTPKTAGKWNVYIPSTAATGAGKADATKDIYLISPTGKTYKNGLVVTP